MNTEVLYMKSIDGNYIREWDAKVIRAGDGYVVLDRTAFYPLGGGQPSDTGILLQGGKEYRVKEVRKKGIIKHIIDGELPEEGDVHAVLDWERRYGHMRMHTSQHIISGVVYDMFHARTVGNQIYQGKSRVDFHPVSFSEDDLRAIEDKSNEIIEKSVPVGICEEERGALERKVDSQRANLDQIPESVKRLRIVEVEGFDLCPCAGTHVKNTSELGVLKIMKKESKGKDKERLVYVLE